MSENEFEEATEVMKRIEETAGTKAGGMLVKGTMMVQGKEIIRTTFGNTLSEALKTHFLEEQLDDLKMFVREQNPFDKIDFIRVDYLDPSGKETYYQILIGLEDDFICLVLQEYEVRDLRIRQKGNKDFKGYQHDQNNYFFPSLNN